MEKKQLTSSDTSNCINDILVLHISGTQAENCSALFYIVSKIRLIVVSEQERKSLLSCPTEALGNSTPSTLWPKSWHKDF